jgi:DNA-binding NarL/FixJ family response regulator
VDVDQAPLRVAVLSRYALVRVGLSTLVSTQPQRAVVIDVAALDGHLQHADVVLYDLASLAVREDSTDLEHLLRGQIPVVGLARDARSELTEGARALGVASIVPEQTSAEALVEALESAAGRGPTGPSTQDNVAALNDRELQVLRLVAAGLTNQAIAHELYISVNSVKTYIRSAYRKIGVTRRPQAVVWAIHNGLGSWT